MKKTFIGALVGGLIIFIWQFLSFAALNLHGAAQQYTPKQTEIQQFMNTQALPEGGYFIPTVPQTASAAEHDQHLKNMEGKPWMMVQYHNRFEQNMYVNMFRGFASNVVMVFLFLSLLSRVGKTTKGSVFAAALLTGGIVFINAPYTNFIWYQTFDIWAHLADALVAWGLTGLWLGWWLNKGQRKQVMVLREEAVEMA